MTKLSINTFISNYIPEFGYSSKELKEFLPIHHPEAKKVAQKCLDYESRIYLNGFVEIIYEKKFLTEIEGTDDLLFTWDDLAQIVIKQEQEQEQEDEFEMNLLDNGSTLNIVRDGANYKLILGSVHLEEKNSTSILSIPSDELIEEIKGSFELFVDFCKSELVFDEESEYNHILDTQSKMKDF